MTQELVSKSRFMRVQSYGQTLSISVPKEMAQELQLRKGETVRAWIDRGIFHAERAKE